MRINRLYVMVGAVISFFLFAGFAAYADEADQSTIITFSAPVQIPGKVLPAGTYLFRMADNGSEPNVVRILNAQGTKLYETVTTIPTDRLEPTGTTTITLAEQGPQNPEVLMKWYYPGSLTGHEFLYSASEEKKLARDHMQTIAANREPAANSVHSRS